MMKRLRAFSIFMIVRLCFKHSQLFITIVGNSDMIRKSKQKPNNVHKSHKGYDNSSFYLPRDIGMKVCTIYCTYVDPDIRLGFLPDLKLNTFEYSNDSDTIHCSYERIILLNIYQCTAGPLVGVLQCKSEPVLKSADSRIRLQRLFFMY